jgi:hypothetical protein
VDEVEEKIEDWRINLGSDFEKIIAFINYIRSVDVHFFWDKF